MVEEKLERKLKELLFNLYYIKDFFYIAAIPMNVYPGTLLRESIDSLKGILTELEEVKHGREER